MYTDQTNDNIVNDIILSPIKVVGIVIKHYLSRSNLTGFHNFEYDLEKICEIDI